MISDGKKFHHIIADAKLDRIMRDARYVGADSERFYYDHGSLLVDGRRGDGSRVSKALLIDAGSVQTFGSGRILQHAAPSVMEELARGYWLAKNSGLLGPCYPSPHSRTPEFFDAQAGASSLPSTPSAPVGEVCGKLSDPHPHWSVENKNENYPKTIEEWDPHKDQVGQHLTLAVKRLRMAMDRDDPRAPDEMALVSRWDLTTLVHDWWHKCAVFDIWCEERKEAREQESAVTSTDDAWCKHCGCGNDALGYKHLETCGRTSTDGGGK